jgi:glycosyltransferase involved in cell wall biosynthesis
MRPPLPVAGIERILLVTEPGVDGVFRHVEGLAHFLLGRGYDVDLAYSGRRGGDDLRTLVRRIELHGGRTLDLGVGNAPSGRDAVAWCRLRAFVRARRPQVIHAHSSKAGALVRLLPEAGAAVLYTPHAYYGLRPGSHWQGRLYNRLERLLGRRGFTINVSESEAGFAATVLRVDATQRTTIFNGIDLARFRPPTADERRAARAAFDVWDETPLLACVARLCAQKDPHTLYRAFAAARLKDPKLRLVHIGTGPHPEYGQDALPEELRLQVIRRASLDPLTLYHAADALIVTSRYEGLSLVVLEGLACGLPLVLSDVPGNDDVLRHRPAQAFSFPAGDALGAASAIGRWRAEAAPRENNHRALARRFYDSTRNFRAVERTYLKCVRGGASRQMEPAFAP